MLISTSCHHHIYRLFNYILVLFSVSAINVYAVNCPDCKHPMLAVEQRGTLVHYLCNICGKKYAKNLTASETQTAPRETVEPVETDEPDYQNIAGTSEYTSQYQDLSLEPDYQNTSVTGKSVSNYQYLDPKTSTSKPDKKNAAKTDDNDDSYTEMSPPHTYEMEDIETADNIYDEADPDTPLLQYLDEIIKKQDARKVHVDDQYLKNQIITASRIAPQVVRHLKVVSPPLPSSAPTFETRVNIALENSQPKYRRLKQKAPGNIQNFLKAAHGCRLLIEVVNNNTKHNMLTAFYFSEEGPNGFYYTSSVNSEEKTIYFISGYSALINILKDQITQAGDPKSEYYINIYTTSICPQAKASNPISIPTTSGSSFSGSSLESAASLQTLSRSLSRTSINSVSPWGSLEDKPHTSSSPPAAAFSDSYSSIPIWRSESQSWVREAIHIARSQGWQALPTSASDYHSINEIRYRTGVIIKHLPDSFLQTTENNDSFLLPIKNIPGNHNLFSTNIIFTKISIDQLINKKRNDSSDHSSMKFTDIAEGVEPYSTLLVVASKTLDDDTALLHYQSLIKLSNTKWASVFYGTTTPTYTLSIEKFPALIQALKENNLIADYKIYLISKPETISTRASKNTQPSSKKTKLFRNRRS